MPNIEENPNKSSNHFEALFNYATMGILITDSQGKITAVNPFALNEFGYAEEELMGQRIELLIPVRYHHNHEKHRNKYFEKTLNAPDGSGYGLICAAKRRK